MLVYPQRHGFQNYWNLDQYFSLAIGKSINSIHSFPRSLPRFQQTLILFFIFNLCLSSPPPKKIYLIEDFEPLYENLNKEYGQHKVLPKGFELATLVALSHYPELKNIHIRFILKETFIPLVSRPSISSMFKKKDKWEYLVIISNHSNEEMETILLKNLSFNAQIGIIGHELGHTVFYLNKKLGDMIGIGFNYINKKYRADFEKDTDRRAVDHGLGWQLYDYAIFSRSLPDMTRENIDWIDQYYMNGASIMNYMRSHPLYKKDLEKILPL